MLYKLLSSLAWLALKSGFYLRVEGMENLPKRGGFILASNHSSNLDPVVLGAVSCRRLDFMAKQDLFEIFFLGWLISKVGSFPVKRGSADLSAIKEAVRRLSSGHAMLLFPEGSRSNDGSVSRPLPGVGFLAAKANVPVVPAFVSGTAKALPKGAKFIRPARIAVRFGRQITLERRMPYQEFAQLIMEKIRNLSC